MKNTHFLFNLGILFSALCLSTIGLAEEPTAPSRDSVLFRSGINGLSKTDERAFLATFASMDIQQRVKLEGIVAQAAGVDPSQVKLYLSLKEGQAEVPDQITALKLVIGATLPGSIAVGGAIEAESEDSGRTYKGSATATLGFPLVFVQIAGKLEALKIKLIPGTAGQVNVDFIPIHASGRLSLGSDGLAGSHIQNTFTVRGSIGFEDLHYLGPSREMFRLDRKLNLYLDLDALRVGASDERALLDIGTSLGIEHYERMGEGYLHWNLGGGGGVGLLDGKNYGTFNGGIKYMLGGFEGGIEAVYDGIDNTGSALITFGTATMPTASVTNAD